MKKFLAHVWRRDDGLVVWSAFGAISIILSTIVSIFNEEFELLFSWWHAIILVGFSWMWLDSYRQYRKYYSGIRSSDLKKNSANNVEAYKYILPAIDGENARGFSESVSGKLERPEDFFSTPRKINWEELNKTRKYHGDLGEMFVHDLEKNYLTKIGRPDLAEKVQHVSKEGDGHGYDIKSFYENGTEKFIEVKATNASSGSTFNISKNEFNFLQNHLNNAVVYHVHNVNNDHETTVTVYPASAVVNSPDISPSGYVVKM